MKDYIQKIAIILILVLGGMSLWFVSQNIESIKVSIASLSNRVLGIEEEISEAPDLGSFQTVGGIPYYLFGSGVGTTDTSITLTDFDVPVAGHGLTMSDFGDIGYLTLEPGNTSRQEFISFTGVTQNADDSATLTGVTRGLSPIAPYTASSTLQKAHPGGSVAVLSNPPQLYEQLATLANSEAITGLWTFNTVLPTSSLSATTSNQFTTKTYVDNVANAGAATSTETNGGIVELATQIEMASSTDGGANKPLVLQAKYATSTPDVRGLYAIISENDGYLNQSWLDLTEEFTLTGDWTFNAGGTATTTFNRGVDIDADADTPLVLNTAETVWPSANASGILKNDGSGNLSWGASPQISYSVDPDNASAQTYASTTLITIPSGFIQASSTIEVNYTTSSLYNGAGGIAYLRTSDGTNVVSHSCSDGTNGETSTCEGKFFIAFNDTNSQSITETIVNARQNADTSVSGSVTTNTVDFSGEITLVFVAYAPNASTSMNPSSLFITARK